MCGPVSEQNPLRCRSVYILRKYLHKNHLKTNQANQDVKVTPMSSLVHAIVPLELLNR